MSRSYRRDVTKSKTQASYEDEKAKGVNQVIEMLVQGGYHRARISAIDTFDKIAGGLAWGILCSRESIDVDFRENSNIGHKLKFGENIENALVAMKCPFELQTHQIQGLDIPKLIPVLAWLLKRVATVRKEQEASIYRHAELLFGRSYGTHPRDTREPLKVKVPNRVFKRSADEDLSTELAHVSSVLLEYGHTYQVRTDVDVDEDDEDVRAKEQLKKMQEEQERELQAMQEKMSQMASIKERSKLSSSAVGGLVAQQGDAIAQVSAAFNERMAVMHEEAAKDDEQLAALQKKKSQLEKRQTQLEQEKGNLQSLLDEQEAATRDAEKMQKDKGKKERRAERIKEEIRKIEQELAKDPSKKELFKKIMKLLKQIEKTENKTEEFRSECTQGLAGWKKKLSKLAQKVEDAKAMNEDEEVISGLLQQIDTLRTKLLPLVKIVAEKDKEIAGLNRQIDSVPSRQELTQYEKRFTELYEQVSWKFEETKLNFNKYNVLSEKAKYVSKESELMKSLEQQIVEVLGPKSPDETKEALADGIHDIVGKVLANKTRVADELSQDQSTLDACIDKHTQLISVQRTYLQNIKDLQEEFNRNEQLLNKTETMQRALEGAEG